MPIIIDPESLTFNQIKADLVSYLEGRPDYATWKDFLESGAGTTVTELMAGLGSFLSYHALGSRRESYLTQRRLYSSAINIAQTVGYPVNRYSAPRITLTLDRSDPGKDSPIAWSKYDPIGSIGGVEISLLENITIPGGSAVDGSVQIEVIAGDWELENWTAESDDNFQNFLIENVGIDNNFYEDTLILLIDEGEGYETVPLTKYPELLTEYQAPPLDPILRVLDRTNIDGVILVFGNGVFGKEIGLGDLFQLEYVTTLGPLPIVTVTPDDVNLEISGVITRVEVWNPGSGPDSLEKLAVVPAGYYGTLRRAVTGEDHSNLLVSYSGDLVSSDWDTPVMSPCCTIYLSYLFEDRHLLTDSEKSDIQEYMLRFKPVGEQIVFTDPIEYGMEFELIVVVDVGTIKSDALADIQEIIRNLTMKVGDTFKVGTVTASIGKLEYVDRVYLIKPYNDNELSYEEYLYFLDLSSNITITENKDVVVSITPDNDGFFRRLVSGVNTSVIGGRLISSSSDFSSVSDGDLVVNESMDTTANVNFVVNNNELDLDQHIFPSIGDSFSVYDKS